MHRIVWLVVLTVIANLILEFSGVVAQTNNINNRFLPQSAAQTQIGTEGNAINEVENVEPVDTTRNNVRPKPQRNQLFDNIFRVNTNKKYTKS